MSIIESKTIKYDTQLLSYIVFVVNSNRVFNDINYSECSDKEFIKESLDQQFFYSLEDFTREFNEPGGLVNQETDYIRIMPMSRYLELMN